MCQTRWLKLMALRHWSCITRAVVIQWFKEYGKIIGIRTVRRIYSFGFLSFCTHWTINKTRWSSWTHDGTQVKFRNTVCSDYKWPVKNHNERTIRKEALVLFADGSKVDAETGTSVTWPNLKLSKSLVSVLVTCQAEMLDIEVSDQECFERGIKDATIYILSNV